MPPLKEERISDSDIACYHLPVAAIGNLITRPVAGLAPTLTPEDGVVPYTAFDCFDQSLRRAGQLLLQTKNTLELIRSNGQPISQAAHCKIEFASDIPDGAIKKALASISPLRRLLPVGSGELQQAVLTLLDDEEKTHCRAHLLYLTTLQGQSAAVAMLEGIRGYADSLDALQRRVHELGAVPFNNNALYRWLFPKQSSYNPKPEIAIGGDETAFDAANKIIATHIPIARANEPGIIADHDTEFLHDYRIQLRKIRSVISLFKGIYNEPETTDLKTRFSALMAPSGPLRDLDVYLLEKHSYYALLPQSLHGGLDTLYDMFAQQREAEQIKLSEHLRSREYKREIASLAALFAKPKGMAQGPNAALLAHEYASDLIWARYRKVCKIAKKINAGTPDAEVHTLRIECKKLRYLMEFFGSVFPATAFTDLLRPLKGLQDNLGRFNDYSVQQVSLHAAMLKITDNQKTPDLHVAQSVGALIAVLHNLQLKERAKVVKSFSQFNSPQTQQTFKELFQGNNGQP